MGFLSDFFLSMNSFRHQNYKKGNTETENSWYNWLINYIPEIIKKMGSVEDKIISFCKANTTENYSKPTHVHVNSVYGHQKKPRKQKN